MVYSSSTGPRITGCSASCSHACVCAQQAEQMVAQASTCKQTRPPTCCLQRNLPSCLLGRCNPLHRGPWAAQLSSPTLAAVAAAAALFLLHVITHQLQPCCQISRQAGSAAAAGVRGVCSVAGQRAEAVIRHLHSSRDSGGVATKQPLALTCTTPLGLQNRAHKCNWPRLLTWSRLRLSPGPGNTPRACQLLGCKTDAAHCCARPNANSCQAPVLIKLKSSLPTLPLQPTDARTCVQPDRSMDSKWRSLKHSMPTSPSVSPPQRLRSTCRTATPDALHQRRSVTRRGPLLPPVPDHDAGMASVELRGGTQRERARQFCGKLANKD